MCKREVVCEMVFWMLPISQGFQIYLRKVYNELGRQPSEVGMRAMTCILHKVFFLTLWIPTLTFSHLVWHVAPFPT